MKPGRELSYKGVQLRDLERATLYELISALHNGSTCAREAIRPTEDINRRYFTPAEVEAALQGRGEPANVWITTRPYFTPAEVEASRRAWRTPPIG